MAATPKFLTDEQWRKIAPLLPSERPGFKGGRPKASNREVLEGILWILRTGARWQDLPLQYPHPSTCWRRLKGWTEQGLWLKIWHTFLSQLDAERLLDW
jgi:transposase